MARPIRFPIALVALLSCVALVRAQTRQTVSAPPSQVAETESVTLGQSVVALNGPWKFQVGDSPIDPAMHKPLWADPGFDDSTWETIDLTLKSGSLDPIVGTAGYEPGWAKKGHPGYWSYAWYRIRVKLSAQPQQDLALFGSDNVDDGYQVFVNGQLLGGFGDFSASRPVMSFTQPMMFLLPRAAIGSAERGSTSLVLAFRFWMEPNTLVNDPNAGGFHSVPMLGDAKSIDAVYQNAWSGLIRAYALDPIEGFLFLLLAIVSFSLILFDRSDRVYLWIGVIFLLCAIDSTIVVLGTWTTTIGEIANNFWQSVFLNPLIHVGWVMVWWFWFRLTRPHWLPRAVASMTVLYMGSNLLDGGYFFTVVSGQVGLVFHFVSIGIRLAFLGLSLWIVAQGIRQQGLDGWLVLPAVILSGISRFALELRFLGIWLIWFPFGLRFTLGDLANILLVTALALLLLRRLLLSVRHQRRMALDVKQAQEVQQVILPEARTLFPGLVVESEYRPALEVGGDFFQIIPHSSDGSLLIVAGDVAGKGLKAGMLVALLVGATRSTAETSTEPLAILQALNRRLLGRGDAQATCLALRIAQDGEVTLANAGHIPPYLNGDPLKMEGALPLGMMEGADFSLMRFKLTESDRLVVLSDGVAEARDADGKLFGFDRIDELLHGTTTAAKLADAALTFGQEDDISVISVTRTAIREPVPA